MKYPLSYGLSYTEFEYSERCLSGSSLKDGDVLKVTVDVKNIGGFR